MMADAAFVLSPGDDITAAAAALSQEEQLRQKKKSRRVQIPPEQRSAASLRAQAAAEARWGRPKQPKPASSEMAAARAPPERLIEPLTAAEVLGMPKGSDLQSFEQLRQIVQHELPVLDQNHAFKVPLTLTFIVEVGHVEDESAVAHPAVCPSLPLSIAGP
eukprot:COSAG05_NODE_344_length_11005_cov_35.313772_11_plen_161_part_00